MANETKGQDGDGADRRAFLEKASKGAMAAGLIGGYGGLGAIALRYLYPARPDELSWQFVAEVDSIAVPDDIMSLMISSPDRSVSLKRVSSCCTALTMNSRRCLSSG